MSFREFITNRLFRKRLVADRLEFQSIRAPKNPSQKYIDKLVANLLIDKHAEAAHRELQLIGAAAAPSLLIALDDPRFLVEVERSHCMTDQPLDMILGLLAPHRSQELVDAAPSLVRSPSSRIRKTAAIHLAAQGRDDTIPMLADLLKDSDGYVRSYVKIGVQRALEQGRCSDLFRKRMYDLFLAQCDQEWEGGVNDAAVVVVELDKEQAAIDFADERWLSPSNPYVYKILEQCNQAEIRLPEPLVRQLLDHSLPKAVGERCYPHQYIVAGALEALALNIGDQARPLLEIALSSDQDEVQESAARALAKLSGVNDPVNFVTQLVETQGYEALNAPQRVVYCAFWFDAEVCNGGLMQFFGNSTGDHAADTLEALRALEHPEATHALDEAMRYIGPLSREPDQDMRLAAFEGRFDELQAKFEPLESEYYRTQGVLRQRMLLYAAQHSSHFG